MEQNTRSLLQFYNYYIEKFIFTRNISFSAPNYEITYQFNAEVSVSENKDKAKVTLSCICFDEKFEEGNAPFYLNSTIVGNFGLEQAEDVAIDQFRIHAIAIMLPYLRSVITSFTAQTGMSPVIIPPLNVFEMFKFAEAES